MYPALLPLYFRIPAMPRPRSRKCARPSSLVPNRLQASNRWWSAGGVVDAVGAINAATFAPKPRLVEVANVNRSQSAVTIQLELVDEDGVDVQTLDGGTCELSVWAFHSSSSNVATFR